MPVCGTAVAGFEPGIFLFFLSFHVDQILPSKLFQSKNIRQKPVRKNGKREYVTVKNFFKIFKEIPRPVMAMLHSPLFQPFTSATAQTACPQDTDLDRNIA